MLVGSKCHRETPLEPILFELVTFFLCQLHNSKIQISTLDSQVTWDQDLFLCLILPIQGDQQDRQHIPRWDMQSCTFLGGTCRLAHSCARQTACPTQECQIEGFQPKTEVLDGHWPHD